MTMRWIWLVPSQIWVIVDPAAVSASPSTEPGTRGRNVVVGPSCCPRGADGAVASALGLAAGGDEATVMPGWAARIACHPPRHSEPSDRTANRQTGFCTS